MNTQDALNILQIASDNAGAEITKQNQFQSALGVAISQLKGLLDTPSADLAKAQSDLKNANDTISTLITRAEIAENKVTDLQTQLTATTQTAEPVQTDTVNSIATP